MCAPTRSSIMSSVARLIWLIPGGTGEAVGTIEERPDATPGAGERAMKALETHELEATNVTPQSIASTHRLADKVRQIGGMMKQVKTRSGPFMINYEFYSNRTLRLNVREALVPLAE